MTTISVLQVDSVKQVLIFLLKKITLCLLTMKTEASKFSVGSIKIDVGWSDGSSNIFTIENIVSQYEKGSFFPNFNGGKFPIAW